MTFGVFEFSLTTAGLFTLSHISPLLNVWLSSISFFVCTVTMELMPDCARCSELSFATFWCMLEFDPFPFFAGRKALQVAAGVSGACFVKSIHVFTCINGLFDVFGLESCTVLLVLHTGIVVCGCVRLAPHTGKLTPITCTCFCTHWWGTCILGPSPSPLICFCFSSFLYPHDDMAMCG